MSQATLVPDVVPESTEMYQEHIGKILCCLCGCSISPNAANMCGECLRQNVDLSTGLNKQATVVFCKECSRYQRGTAWQTMELESADLLALCLKRIKGLEKLKLVDAGFIWTEPHSRRLRVKITVQKEAAELNGVIVQQTFTVELVVTTQQCEDCQKSYTEHTWTSCVQIRQKVDHKRTFLLLEQLILKHGMNHIVSWLVDAPGGLDLFFANKARSLQMLDFVTSVVPSRSKQSKRLVSQDFKNNVANYKHTIVIDIVPICRLDLVCLPKKLAQLSGGISPLLICCKVSTSLRFLDPETLQTVDLTSSKFWQYPFRTLCTSRQLVEYTILDVVPTGKTNGKFALAEVTCVRSSDLGVNDTVFETVTHLGHLLKAGDLAAGYDLTSAVFNDDDMVALKNVKLPDVVLVKKSFERKNRAGRRKFKLKSLQKQAPEDVDAGRHDVAQAEQDEEIFLRELEEDMELRCRVNLYKRDDQPKDAVGAADAVIVGTDDESCDDAEFPDVRLDELISDMDHMTSSLALPVADVDDDDASIELGSKRRNGPQ